MRNESNDLWLHVEHVGRSSLGVKKGSIMSFGPGRDQVKLEDVYLMMEEGYKRRRTMVG